MKIKNFHKICKYVELPLSKIKKIELIFKTTQWKFIFNWWSCEMFNIKKKISSPPDLVTDLPIELVVKILKKQKIKISLVGIEYGSIVIHDGKDFF